MCVYMCVCACAYVCIVIKDTCIVVLLKIRVPAGIPTSAVAKYSYLNNI